MSHRLCGDGANAWARFVLVATGVGGAGCTTAGDELVQPDGSAGELNIFSELPAEVAWGLPSGGQVIGVALAASVAVHTGRATADGSWRSSDVVSSGDGSGSRDSGERIIISGLPVEPGVSTPVSFPFAGRQDCRVWEQGATLQQEAEGWSAGVVTTAEDPTTWSGEVGDRNM